MAVVCQMLLLMVMLQKEQAKQAYAKR